MSNDDELERLLREVDASLAGGKPAPSGREVTPAASAPAKRGGVGGALRTGAVAGVVCGAGVTVATWLFSWLPFDQAPLNAGGGAFVGAFLTGAVLSFRGRG
jgi:hypothetical protein